MRAQENVRYTVGALVFCALLTASDSSLAQTNRVGVITARYTMEANGTGDENLGGSLVGIINQDQDQVSIDGQAQYEVQQTETNLVIGKLITSNAGQTASGNWHHNSWDCNPPPCLTTEWDEAYVSDPAFNPTNVCVTMIHSPDGPDLFVGICAKPSFGVIGSDGRFYPATTGWAWPFGAPCTVQALDKVQGFQFALPNSTIRWNQTLTTNATVHYDEPLPPGEGYGVGDATASRTVTLEYVPDQATVPFTATPTNGLVPLTVQFTSGNVDSANSSIASWAWNFGDGSTNTQQSPSHTYTNAGTFSVTLVATNVNGTAVQGLGPSNITVSRPTVQFTVTPTNGFVPLAVYFTCPHVDSGDNAIVSWQWDFGDGSAFADQRPNQPVTVSHIYAKAKTFSPKLTVTNVWGTAITTNGPKVVVWLPPIFFTASPINGLVPMPVHFGGPGVDSQGYAITNWNWNFGDGSTGTGQNPAHTYTKAGIFAPALVVTNNHGAGIIAFGPNISAGCSEVYAFGVTGVGFDPASGSLTNSDGIHPQAGLTVSGNRLYGVMSGGGNGGSGTIFAVNTDGSDFTSLYNFSALAMAWYTNADGAWPRARLILSGETLFGAASAGGTGSMGDGTLFKINTDGSGFATLFEFPDGSDGGIIPNGLVLSSNTLYGTTAFGGRGNNGTVFKIATDGSGFATIHDFSTSAYDPASGSFTNTDGAYPHGALVLSGATLYGTASGGGSGDGTVFKIGTDGSGFAGLHNFTKSDGTSPSAELLLSGDTLYGTTANGGSGNAGTVFAIGADGTGFSTLHGFAAAAYDASQNYTNSDGAEPYGGLILSGGTLSGTTKSGGSAGSGTIFALNTDGSGFTNLYQFSALVSNTNLDGANPYAGLALSGNTLYGTTFNGGNAGDGALFALSLAAAPPPLNIQCSGNAVVISWPSPSAGLPLQQNSNLATANWTASNFPISDDCTNKSITIPSPTGNLFFRLKSP